MEDLLEAINILAKYTDSSYPTHCEHDILRFNTVDVDDVSDSDISRLSELGFRVCGHVGGFYSYKYGSN